jgi:hypothetical protein
MNTYWLLGREESFLSSYEDFLSVKETSDFLHIIRQD